MAATALSCSGHAHPWRRGWPCGHGPPNLHDEHANPVEKSWLTHDQSSNVVRGSQTSVNDRLDASQLTPCRYGRALLRFLHSLASLRHRHPNKRILIPKVDWKSAYRRVHLVAAMAVQPIVAVSGMLLLALRLTFGGVANPSHWSYVSEIATDLANDLVRQPD